MTLKWNKKTAVLVIAAAALILTAVVLAAGTLSSSGKRQVEAGVNLRTDADRAAYLRGLGWEVDPEPEEVKAVVIPRSFDAVYEQYNALQLAQGFDLSEYCGMEVTVYTYRVRNYPNGDGNVLAVLYIANGQAVGGDIHSTLLDGFIHGLK